MTSPTLSAALADALRRHVEWYGAAHDYRCPGDDTCNCAGKPINDAIAAALAAYDSDSVKGAIQAPGAPKPIHHHRQKRWLLAAAALGSLVGSIANVAARDLEMTCLWLVAATACFAAGEALNRTHGL